MTLRIQIMSDLHLSGARFDFVDCGADVLVLAGDIADEGMLGIFAMVAPVVARGGLVLWVLGNHEFYGQRIESALRRYRTLARKHGVILLHNREFVVGDVRFLGTPLWTDFCVEGEGFKEMAMLTARDMMEDYSSILKNKQLLRPADTLRMHQKSVRFLRSRLAQRFAGKTVVVTHHSPHPKSISPRYQGNLLNASFSSDLTELFYEFDFALWVHGHTHDSYDYPVVGSRVICNPRGYVRPGGHAQRGFNPELVIEL